MPGALEEHHRYLSNGNLFRTAPHDVTEVANSVAKCLLAWKSSDGRRLYHRRVSVPVAGLTNGVPETSLCFVVTQPVTELERAGGETEGYAKWRLVCAAAGEEEEDAGGGGGAGACEAARPRPRRPSSIGGGAAPRDAYGVRR